MRFGQVTGPVFTCVCLGCKQPTRAGDGVGPTFADLDGEAFKAYYCEPCMRAARDGEATHWETPCPKREDKQHCDCWYDGERCCACGDGGVR